MTISPEKIHHSTQQCLNNDNDDDNDSNTSRRIEITKIADILSFINSLLRPTGMDKNDAVAML